MSNELAYSLTFQKQAKKEMTTLNILPAENCKMTKWAAILRVAITQSLQYIFILCHEKNNLVPDTWFQLSTAL